MSHVYCRIQIKFAREDAKKKGVKIPRISGSMLSPDEFAVYIGSDFYTEHSSCCAFHARAEAIHEYIEREAEKQNEQI